MNESNHRRIETNLSRYGVDNISKLPWVQSKRLSAYEKKRNFLGYYYKKPEVHTIINGEDLKIYRLNKDVSDTWMNEYYPLKAAKGTVLAIGLVKYDTIYCMMTFKKSRDKRYHAELSRMYMLPGYYVKNGFSILSKFASDYGLYNIVAYVNFCFDNFEDYEEIGMKSIRYNQRKKWWWNGSNFISDASRRQNNWYESEMIFSGYSSYHDLGTAVYEFK